MLQHSIGTVKARVQLVKLQLLRAHPLSGLPLALVVGVCAE